LQAVLKVVDERGADRILCLGDVVGYGASPNECLNLIRERSHMVLLGNHDSAASGGGEAARFNPNAKAAALWTARVLTPQNRDFLRGLSLSRPIAPYLYVHASPRGPARLGVHLRPVRRRAAVPVLHRATRASSVTRTSRRSSSGSSSGCVSLPPTQLRFDPVHRYIVNVGSVGQPRDRDPRACFVVLNEPDGKIEFVRVPYDIEAAQEKIRAVNLPPVLAARLTTGE